MRRRERNLWTDTPLAKLFTPRAEWHLLRTRALVQQLAQALRRNLSARRIDPYAVFDAALAADSVDGQLPLGAAQSGTSCSLVCFRLLYFLISMSFD